MQRCAPSHKASNALRQPNRVQYTRTLRALASFLARILQRHCSIRKAPRARSDRGGCDGAATAPSLRERICEGRDRMLLAKREGLQSASTSCRTFQDCLLEPGIFTESTMPTMVASVGGSAG